MISAMDGSLPKKPCRTCKNKFHAGCLYKVSRSASFRIVIMLTFVIVVQYEPFIKLSTLPL